MDYNEFDNTLEYKGESQYNELHKLIIEILTDKPLGYYDILELVPKEHKYHLSGQLQYLKSRGIIQIKQFGYDRYWGLSKPQRRPDYIKQRYGKDE